MNKIVAQYRTTLAGMRLDDWAYSAKVEIERLEAENLKLKAVVDLLETQIDDLIAETRNFY